MTPDELAEVGAQLAARVRDEDPAANGRWLAEQVPDPQDWWRLCFVLAAAVPTERSWASLTYWAAAGSCVDSRPTVSPEANNRIDEIAIERACHGEKVKLSRAERQLAVDKLTRRGLGRYEIAERLGISDRTVERWRAATRRAS